MPQYCGVLKRVGSKEGDVYVNSGGNAMSTVRVSGKVSIVEVGDTLLRDVGCTNDIYDLLEPGREVCLYVHNHFFRTPIIIGVKYMDDNKKYPISIGALIANTLSYVVMYPLLVLVGGFMIGLMGGKDGGFMGTLGILFILGGLGVCAWNAANLVMAYRKMQAA